MTDASMFGYTRRKRLLYCAYHLTAIGGLSNEKMAVSLTARRYWYFSIIIFSQSYWSFSCIPTQAQAHACS
jgi:hypothetical protein